MFSLAMSIICSSGARIDAREYFRSFAAMPSRAAVVAKKPASVIKKPAAYRPQFKQGDIL